MQDNSKLTKVKNRLELYYEAEEKVLAGQSYTIGSHSVTRADLGKIQDKIKELEKQKEMLEQYGTTKRKVVRAVPWDR